MNLKDKRTNAFVFFVLTASLLFFLIVIIQNEKEKKMYDVETMRILEDTLQPEIAVYYPLSKSVDNATDMMVRWWKNEIDDKYYLFLPSGIENKEFYWLFQKEMNVWIEKNKIESGDCFRLSEGTYEIEFEFEKEYYKETLEIMQSNSIATVFLETASGNLDYVHENKGNRETGKYTILNADGKLQYAGGLESIRGRGNVTWEETEKKAYQITLETKTGLLSMPEEKHWVLIPNSFDASLIKNVVCYELASKLGISFTPEMEYVDLYINGEYRGNYLLSEKTEIGENRVAIKDLEKEMEIMNEQPLECMERFEIFIDEEKSYKGYYISNQPSDITGGYLLEMEISPRYREENSGFISDLGQKIVIKSPQYASYEQVTYIRNKYQEMEDALFSDNGVNPDTGKHYSEYLDMDSAIGKFLVEEISKNLDTALTSQYLYKYNDSVSDKFYLGPVWDFDKSLGVGEVNRTGVDLAVPEGIHAGTEIRQSNLLYGLYQKDDFKKNMIEVFEKEACPIISNMTMEMIPNLQMKILNSSRMNLVRWNYYGDISLEEKTKKYMEEVGNIQNFLVRRIEFLRKEWGLNN